MGHEATEGGNVDEPERFACMIDSLAGDTRSLRSTPEPGNIRPSGAPAIVTPEGLPTGGIKSQFTKKLWAKGL